MKLLDKDYMNYWAYLQCWNGNDTQEIRDLITTSHWAYEYCYNIKDIEEMWRKIKEEWWAFRYCYSVKDREEVRKYIISKIDLRSLEFKRNYKYENNE